MSTSEATTDFKTAQMTWTQDNNKGPYRLKNWSATGQNRDARVDIHFNEIPLQQIRVIWCEDSLKKLIKENAEFRRMLRDNAYTIVNGEFLHASCKDVGADMTKIIAEQKDLIGRSVPNEKQIVITSGSQAAGKSTFLNYEVGTHESIAEYETRRYYVVDSDRYLEQFDLAVALNSIPLIYLNYRGVCVNSLKELTIKLKNCNGGGDPHKHIEWVLEQWMLERDYNFIKQGTQLWLDAMIDKPKYDTYDKTILFIWIAKPQMEARLSRRLSDVGNIRYFMSVWESMNQYDGDWHAIADQLINKHYSKIFTDARRQANKYKFCFIFNDGTKKIALDTMSCFDNSFGVIKRGTMTAEFLINLLLYLSVKRQTLSQFDKPFIEANESTG
jgi:hypothetical protein